jgi:hypothetical protein
MDILAHGLWATIAAKAVNKKLQASHSAAVPQLNVWASAFWGIFPDLFAFTPIFIWLVFQRVSGNNIPAFNPSNSEAFDNTTMGQLTHTLYHISHSLITFFVVTGIVFLITRRVPWEMAGWLLHILIDIPTHSQAFFPTPILWPVSGITFNGFSWAATWFMVLNYSAIIITFFFVR